MLRQQDYQCRCDYRHGQAVGAWGSASTIAPKLAVAALASRSLEALGSANGQRLLVRSNASKGSKGVPGKRPEWAFLPWRPWLPLFCVLFRTHVGWMRSPLTIDLAGILSEWMLLCIGGSMVVWFNVHVLLAFYLDHKLPSTLM